MPPGLRTHFTTFVYSGKPDAPARGWAHHLARLSHDGHALGTWAARPPSLIDAHLTTELAQLASIPVVVRVDVDERGFRLRPRTIPTGCGAPIDRVEIVTYQREQPRYKHADIAPVRQLLRDAQARGADDILLRCPHTGELLEGSFWTLVVTDGTQVLLPRSSSVLPSTTVATLREELPELGWNQQRLTSLKDYPGALALNAVHGVRRIGVLQPEARSIVEQMQEQWDTGPRSRTGMRRGLKRL